MLNQLSRALLLFITIIVASIIFPHYYWLAFDEPINAPLVTYSSISHKIIIRDYNKSPALLRDEDNTFLTDEQVDSLTPLSNYMILAAKGKMPEKIDGIKIDIEEVRKNKFTIRFRPYLLDYFVIPLYPLFESKPPRLRLELPREMFRFNNRMEFITTQNNEINEELTGKYTESLTALNFQFPAKKVFGNPTTRKPFDEGYFVIDQAEQMFHIKMINGAVFCKSVPVPDDLHIRYMIVYESNIREFYSMIISENNRLYFLMMDNYRFQPLPIDGFNAEEDQLFLRGTLFYRHFNIVSPGKEFTVVTDREYKKIKEYEITWDTTDDMWMGMVSQYLFPFTVNLRDENSTLVNFYTSSYNLRSLYLSIILTGLLFLIRSIRKKRLRPWFDYPITLIFGIFGFIAVLIFEDFE